MSNTRSLTRESTGPEVSKAILPIAVGMAIQALLAAQDAEEAERTGVVRSGLSLCLMRPVEHEGGWTHEELVQISVGTIPPGKKYAGYAREKCERLCANPDDLSSWPSRNPTAEQYGGAIRLQLTDGSSLVIAISGLPELVDEAAVVEIGKALELITPDEIRQIAGISKNPLIPISAS